LSIDLYFINSVGEASFSLKSLSRNAFETLEESLFTLEIEFFSKLKQDFAIFPWPFFKNGFRTFYEATLISWNTAKLGSFKEFYFLVSSN